MAERLLLITDKKNDVILLESILCPKGFDIEDISHVEDIEDAILTDKFAAVLADFDLLGTIAHHVLEVLQKNRSRSCFILYGEKVWAHNISEILQKGAYAFVPRTFLSEQIHDILLGGLENRRAFIEILGMADVLREVNDRLTRERENLRKRNQELNLISQISRKVAYDLNWKSIIPGILSSGFLEVMNTQLLGILYCIGGKWHLALHLGEKEINSKLLDSIKEHMRSRFYSMSGESLSSSEITVRLYPSKLKLSSCPPISFSEETVMPLTFAGKPLGMLLTLPKNNKKIIGEKIDLMSTISTILSMSLRNAQEYHTLKEMAVTDGLTGIYNHKGFKDLMRMELQRAKRYNNSLSLIMIDVDYFKTINDSLGHRAGDYVLREMAACLKNSLRSNDIVARYGGDEFAILLPETNMPMANTFVKRLLATVRNHSFVWKGKRIKVGISYGIGATGELKDRKNEEEFVQKADTRLYAAKRSQNTWSTSSSSIALKR